MLGRILRQLKYTKDHEWVKISDGIATVGISKFAQKALGEVVFVEVKTKNSELKQGDILGAVESVKAASDVYSPVSGIITQVNEKLNDEPNLINDSAEDLGWLAKIKLSGQSSNLMTKKEYTAFCNK